MHQAVAKFEAGLSGMRVADAEIEGLKSANVELSEQVRPTPCILHPKPCTLHPTPCTLHPTPYTLHPSLYILHPTPYTLPPAP